MLKLSKRLQRIDNRWPHIKRTESYHILVIISVHSDSGVIIHVDSLGQEQRIYTIPHKRKQSKYRVEWN